MHDTSDSRLAELWRNHRGELHLFVRKRVQNEDEAWDIVQEAMTRLTQQQQQQGNAENLRALWYRIAGNLIIDQGRHSAVRSAWLQEQQQLEQPVQHAPETQLAAHQHLQLLQQAVDELPPKCREAFILRKFRDYDQQQIADELSISRRMVEKHLQKALQHCRSRLQAVDAWPP